jgi:hypothetical protein
MYIRQVYNHNKLLFLVVILFTLAQITNNIKHDIAISPVYSYGMYSEKIAPKTSYTVPDIFVDGKQLKAKDYSPQQWDNITLPVIEFGAQREVNSKVWQQDIHRLLPFADSIKFVNKITQTEFAEWYRRHLQNLLNKPVDSVNIVFNTYRFNGTSLTKAIK